MLKTSCRNLLRLPSVGVYVTRLGSGIPSLDEIKKPEDDYQPSKYTIFGQVLSLIFWLIFGSVIHLVLSYKLLSVFIHSQKSLSVIFRMKQSYAGNKRKDPMHYTDRKVGRGYWHFSNTVFHSRPKIHPILEKGIKRNFCIMFALLFSLCIDYNWYVISCE